MSAVLFKGSVWVISIDFYQKHWTYYKYRISKPFVKYWQVKEKSTKDRWKMTLKIKNKFDLTLLIVFFCENLNFNTNLSIPQKNISKNIWYVPRYWQMRTANVYSCFGNIKKVLMTVIWAQKYVKIKEGQNAQLYIRLSALSGLESKYDLYKSQS